MTQQNFYTTTIAEVSVYTCSQENKRVV